jgi:hypothetical protein
MVECWPELRPPVWPTVTIATRNSNQPYHPRQFQFNYAYQSSFNQEGPFNLFLTQKKKKKKEIPGAESQTVNSSLINLSFAYLGPDFLSNLHGRL